MIKIQEFVKIQEEFLEYYGNRAKELYDLQRKYSKRDDYDYKPIWFDIDDINVKFKMFYAEYAYTDYIKVLHSDLELSDENWQKYLEEQETMFKEDYAQLEKDIYKSKLERYNKLKEELGL